MQNLEILNEHELDWDHRPLNITLNLAIHSDLVDENPHRNKHLIFDRNKIDLFLDELKEDLLSFSWLDNTE